VHPITIDELFPLEPPPAGHADPADPPPPTVTAPKAEFPDTGISKFLKPPAPPPENPVSAGVGPDPPPPPPATIKVFINLVPGCVVTALGVFDV
jgi:hypothetical protein